MALPSAAMALAEEAAQIEIPTERPLFPFWHALLVEPNRERRSADWLRERRAIDVYWPNYTRQVGRRRPGQKRRCCTAAVIPGMLFVPCELVPHLDADDLDYAHVHGLMIGIGTAGAPAILRKADIEKIRLMEAKLNLPPEARGVLFKTGQQVRFLDDLYTDWGVATIFEIASEARIGIEVPYLFGRSVKIWVPASEIEAM